MIRQVARKACRLLRGQVPGVSGQEEFPDATEELIAKHRLLCRRAVHGES
jgi:hypothetical protein